MGISFQFGLFRKENNTFSVEKQRNDKNCVGYRYWDGKRPARMMISENGEEKVVHIPNLVGCKSVGRGCLTSPHERILIRCISLWL